ncbi:MAG: hypothetical protein QOG43_1717 [Actinomycetota bacterium]|jgi:hypothetical protein|nr:hypothetical protein [Actinomycetota bacterium]
MSRYERAFIAFSNRGEYITSESYIGQGKRLADLRGDDPGSPAVVRLTAELERMWTQFGAMADTNQDGRVDREEWIPYIEATSAALASLGPDVEWPLEPYIRVLFDVIDADSDGRITQTEYADWLASHGLASDTDIEGAFASLDLDGNGTLSLKEFSQCGRNFWTTSDPTLPGARWMGP